MAAEPDAEAVEQHAHANAGARPLHQRCAISRPSAIAGEDEGAEVERRGSRPRSASRTRGAPRCRRGGSRRRVVAGACGARPIAPARRRDQSGPRRRASASARPAATGSAAAVAHAQLAAAEHEVERQRDVRQQRQHRRPRRSPPTDGGAGRARATPSRRRSGRSRRRCRAASASSARRRCRASRRAPKTKPAGPAPGGSPGERQRSLLAVLAQRRDLRGHHGELATAPWRCRCRSWRSSALLRPRPWPRWPWLRRGPCRGWRCRTAR